MADAQADGVAAVLDELAAVVGADAGATLYLDDGDGVLHPAATSTAATPTQAPQTLRPARLIQRLVGVARQDTEGHRFVRRAPGRLSGDGTGDGTMTLALPGASGFVALSRRAGDPFTEQDRTVARLYARRLADDAATAAPQWVRSGWARQLEAIQRIAARLTRLASVEEVGAAICTETAEVIERDEAHVMIVDSRGVPRGVAGTSLAGPAPPPLPLHGEAANALARALRSGMSVLAEAVSDLGEGRPGTYSMLVVPLHYERRVTGLICLLARGSGRFDDDDLRLLGILSDQAAVAMENARLLRGRDQLVQELAGMLEISEAAGSADDEQQLASLLAIRLRRLTGTDGAFVALWEEGSTELRIVAASGVRHRETMLDVADSPARRQVLREGRPLVIQAADGGHEADQLRRAGAHTLLLLPLNAGGHPVGMVELIAMAGPRHLGEAAIQAGEAMASLAATGLERVRVAQQLRDAADMDLVTAVHNHRYLQERLRQEIARAGRSHAALAVLMLDLDNFKPINDRHGHGDGDRVLRNVGATIKGQLRAEDIVARYGGDEFVVLMPDTTAEQAEHVAQRIVSAVLRASHTLSDGGTVSVGASAGLSVYPTDGQTSAELLTAADAAMYSAKRGGGRQIERSSAPLFGEPTRVSAPSSG